MKIYKEGKKIILIFVVRETLRMHTWRRHPAAFNHVNTVQLITVSFVHAHHVVPVSTLAPAFLI